MLTFEEFTAPNNHRIPTYNNFHLHWSPKDTIQGEVYRNKEYLQETLQHKKHKQLYEKIEEEMPNNCRIGTLKKEERTKLEQLLYDFYTILAKTTEDEELFR